MAGFAASFLKSSVAVGILVFAVMGAVVECASEVESTIAPSISPFQSRKSIAVEGVIFCKSCKYPRIDTFFGATPLVGAGAKLVCNNTKRAVTALGKTDKNGYFFIPTDKVSSFGIHKCRVFLDSSPSAKCKEPTNMNGGVKGSLLFFRKVLYMGTKTVFLFNTLPLAFAPSNTTACVH
ncbi:hypothetical protein H6P81_014240 [Aristolochia fimbriata]|uniref:Uncharacterized protein n=1 Tax=Aristolochia fimbriata TaxID=158543 RepID=A0AAV7EK93_ARIFI|nr:hypothetical protein H6P81_014240 [Aristolochia fimbriata]